jgi:hypothetical protein
MYDSGKIILGLMVFVVLVTYPTWYLFTGGETAPMTDLAYPENEDQKECVYSAEYMRASHMDLLNDWRDKVVREGHRTYTTTTGKKFEMSMTNTCLGCHSNKAQFCDKCHNYLEVSPYCWDCHVDPSQLEIR